MPDHGPDLALRERTSPLQQIAQVLGASACQHCGQPPFVSAPLGVYAAPRPASRPADVAARPADAAPWPADAISPPAAAVDRPADAEATDDDERWLWQLVDDGDKTRAQAPTGADPAEVSAARRAVAEATAVRRKIESQVNAIEVALARAGSWLRPRHRWELVASLRRGRAALVASTARTERAELDYAEVDTRAAERRSYLAAHRQTLEAAENARHELDRRVDDLIDQYARNPDPPAWFRFGLGYPPRADAYPDWLVRARTAIAYRRRHGVDHPLEPTGRITTPPKSNP